MEKENINETINNKDFKKSNLGNRSLAAALIGFIILKAFNFEPVHFKFINLLTLIFEAAVVGAIADWYAVTALFRHPLNIKIPHTNILAQKKDEIAEGISSIMKDFLPHDVIKQHLKDINFSDLLEKNILNESNIFEFKNRIKKFLVNFLNESKKNKIREKKLNDFLDYLKTVDYSKTTSKLGLSFVNSIGYEKILYNFSSILDSILKKNKISFSEKVEEEIKNELPFLLKMFANGKGVLVFDKVLSYVEELKNPNSKIAYKIAEEIKSYCFDLENNPEISNNFNNKIYEILNNEQSKEKIVALLSYFIDKLTKIIENPDNETFDKIMNSLFLNLKENFLGDENKKESINLWLTEFLFNLIEEHNLIEKSSLLIKTEITKLSEEEFISFIEKNVYNDLQYIRLNGAVVGGLGGAIIYITQVLISFLF